METLVNLNRETRELLSLPARQAEALFQSYTMDHQLVLISNTPNPRQKETLGPTLRHRLILSDDLVPFR